MLYQWFKLVARKHMCELIFKEQTRVLLYFPKYCLSLPMGKGKQRHPMGHRTYLALIAKRYYDPYEDLSSFMFTFSIVKRRYAHQIKVTQKASYYEDQDKGFSHKRLLFEKTSSYLWYNLSDNYDKSLQISLQEA